MKSDEDADDATDAICASVADHEADAAAAAAAAAHLEGDDAEDPNDHRGDDAADDDDDATAVDVAFWCNICFFSSSLFGAFPGFLLIGLLTVFLQSVRLHPSSMFQSLSAQESHGRMNGWVASSTL